MKKANLLFIIALIGTIAGLIVLVLTLVTKSYILTQVVFCITCIFGITAAVTSNKKIKKH